MAAPTLQEVLASEPQLAGAIDSMNELVPGVSANKGQGGDNSMVMVVVAVVVVVLVAIVYFSLFSGGAAA